MTIEASLTVLQLDSSPTRTDIKRAFRKAALEYHPDVRGSDVAFIQIKEAYDALMELSDDALARIRQTPKYATQASNTTGSYDPFADPYYDERHFAQPDNPATEGFERQLRAKGCPHCGGFGFITKNIHPEKGFLGRERRFCKCQWQ
jgi:DnaJ-class molecular chaperone